MRGRRSEGSDECLRLLPPRAAGGKLGRRLGRRARSGRCRGGAGGRSDGTGQGGGERSRGGCPAPVSSRGGWSLGRAKAPRAGRRPRPRARLPCRRLPALRRSLEAAKWARRQSRSSPSARAATGASCTRTPPPGTEQRRSRSTNNAGSSSTRSSAPTHRPRPSRSTASSCRRRPRAQRQSRRRKFSSIRRGKPPSRSTKSAAEAVS